jgi:methionyl-tRNA synthetase
MHPSLHLQKLVEKSSKLPNINNVVDCYNIESLKSGLSIWVHDISKIEGEDVVIKLATWKETFIPLWWKEIINIGEWEYACMDNNGERIICRMDCKQWTQTLVSKETKKIFIYAQWNSACDKQYLEDILKQVVNNLETFCGGKKLNNK